MFADASVSENVLNKSCRGCHEDELREDTHFRLKFPNPRMAIYLDKLDARQCASCHGEHQPEFTRTSAVIVAMDF